MPDPFNKAKMTGDTHPPEVESDLPLEEGSADAAGIGGTPSDRGRAMELGRENKPTRGVKKAGLLKDSDEAGRPSHESTREAGRGTDGDRS
jgi:hypothetical protein